MKKNLFSLFLLLILLFLMPIVVFAVCDKQAPEGALTDPLCIDSPQTLIGRVIGAALGIVGSLALLMFIYGGFTWMTSAGSAEKVTKGKGIMVWAAIGLVVIFSSYALVKFVIQGVTGQQGGSGQAQQGGSGQAQP